MKPVFSILLFVAGLVASSDSVAQAFNSKLKFNNDKDLVLSTSDDGYKAVQQAQVSIVLEYYQHGSASNNSNANIKSVLAKYNEHFKEGAEVATLFILEQDVEIGGEKVPAGTFGMFTTIDEQQVILIFGAAEEGGDILD